ncbi:MAG: hypothetical protein JWO05_112 [Gemmatimonadetes bacterium]|nr:hypothetical protein [Gemmatimonadota bacterium]
MSPLDVLVLTADALGSALLGAAVELSGHRPVFPQARESARAALLRVRPRVVLVEHSHPEGGDERFLGPAIMTGARPILVYTGGHQDPHGLASARALAERLGVPLCILPEESEELANLLDAEARA